MAQIKIFRGPEALSGALQEQVSRWAQKEDVDILSVSSCMEKSPMGLCKVNVITLTVNYEKKRATAIYSNPIQSSGHNKKCPYCAEEIKIDAIKCRFCGEWLENEPDLSSTVTPATSTICASPTEAAKNIIPQFGVATGLQKRLLEAERQRNEIKP